VDEIAAALGIEIIKTWAAYCGGVAQVENEDDCVDKKLRNFAGQADSFPTGTVFSEQARDALIACVKDFNSLISDELLMRCMDAEYALFRLVERQICQAKVSGRVFRDIDDFLKTASAIMNRRKTRAGRSLENHVEYVLKKSGIPHVMRPNIDGNPDVVIPSVEAYLDQSFPEQKLVIVGIKTTCKDRWRQVVNEARRISEKHILTIQQGISATQLSQMHSSHIKLIVPAKLHKQYPPGTPITLLTVDKFVSMVKAKLA
jgi:hypothetical protein